MSAPDDLIPYNDFADLLPGLSRRMVERASARGDFPPGVRLSQRSPMLFRRQSVMAWLAARMAPLGAS